MLSEIKYYKIDTKEISYLKFIFEGYDGVAIIRTVEPKEGIIALHIPRGNKPEVESIINDIKKNIKIEEANLNISKVR
ncbi:MAG: DUF4911 domain-containing protein [Desulfobacterales bacterium]|nr:DUF4911 domain-containing protein [Desulfobacterales bacterium]